MFARRYFYLSVLVIKFEMGIKNTEATHLKKA